VRRDPGGHPAPMRALATHDVMRLVLVHELESSRHLARACRALWLAVRAQALPCVCLRHLHWCLRGHCAVGAYLRLANKESRLWHIWKTANFRRSERPLASFTLPPSSCSSSLLEAGELVALGHLPQLRCSACKLRGSCPSTWLAEPRIFYRSQRLVGAAPRTYICLDCIWAWVLQTSPCRRASPGPRGA